MPDNRPSLQINQQDVINVPETNWPDPLVDHSNKLKVVVTNGSNGTQKNFDALSTAGQDQLSLAEGKAAANTGNMVDQGSHANQLQTSQQNASDHSETEGEQGD